MKDYSKKIEALEKKTKEQRNQINRALRGNQLLIELLSKDKTEKELSDIDNKVEELLNKEF